MSADTCIRNIYADLNFNDTTVSTVLRTYALSILGTPVLTAATGAAYAGFTVFGSGGRRPYSYSLIGSWPSGLSVDATSGVVSGTPTAAGSYPALSVRVTDDYGTTADLPTFTLTVGTPEPYFAPAYFGKGYFGVYA